MIIDSIDNLTLNQYSYLDLLNELKKRVIDLTDRF